jgi:hypothetical protein
MKQWHPVFAQLLRPLVEDYYEVQTTVPVGDARAKPTSCCCAARRGPPRRFAACGGT